MTIRPNQTDPGATADLEYDAERDAYVLAVHDPFRGSIIRSTLPESVVDSLARRIQSIQGTDDEVTRRFIDMARQVKSLRPQPPNGNMPATMQETVAREYDTWERHMAALRLLIGTRLTNAALED